MGAVTVEADGMRSLHKARSGPENEVGVRSATRLTAGREGR